jgi:carboxymethylenebutenolidase
MPNLSLGPGARGSQPLDAYLARPDGPGRWPGVVAIHEAFGLDDVLRRQCDRLAAAGYLTLAPDLFSDGGARRCVISTMRALTAGHGKPFADIEAARRWLLDHQDCTGRVGVIGFCMGGGFALVTASRGFDVASVNYGMLPRRPEKALVDSCPIVASYGSRDPMTLGAGRRLERTLGKLGVEHEVKVYPGAGHSFLNDAPNGPAALRPLMRIANVGPDPDVAADAWARIEAFFAEHLAGDRPG